MIRKLIPVLLAAALSACANTGTARSAAAPAAVRFPAASDRVVGASQDASSARPGNARKTCDASALQSRIGQKATPAVQEALRSRSGSANARILRPGQLVTMEYNDTRLNLIVDGQDVMTAIRCG